MSWKLEISIDIQLDWIDHVIQLLVVLINKDNQFEE